MNNAMQLDETNLNTQHQARQSYIDCLDGVVRVPLDSAGTRKISKRARGSSRGGIPYFSPLLQKYIVLKTESHLEGSSLFVAMSDPNVVHIWDQPTSINYEDADGKLAHYTADARLEYRCGRKVLVETKPSAVARSQRIDLKLRYIADFVPPEFADKITLFTDKSCPRWFVADARLLHEFSKHPDTEADNAIADIANDLDGEITMGALAARTGLAGRGFRAAFRAVFRGDLQRTRARGLSPDSRVAVSGHVA
jgi:hypothetical protein